MDHLPSGYLTVRHGKIHRAIKNGKPCISMGHGNDHGELLVITRPGISHQYPIYRWLTY
jgi:hypothetical protein